MQLLRSTTIFRSLMSWSFLFNNHLFAFTFHTLINFNSATHSTHIQILVCPSPIPPVQLYSVAKWTRGYSSVVEHSTADREVPGSNPGVPWTFYSSTAGYHYIIPRAFQCPRFAFATRLFSGLQLIMPLLSQKNKNYQPTVTSAFAGYVWYAT